jgi:hypothetical protein
VSGKPTVRSAPTPGKNYCNDREGVPHQLVPSVTPVTAGFGEGAPRVSASFDGAESYWLYVLALFNDNQQLNEACNKVWATRELQNATRKGVWKKTYRPVGGQFGPSLPIRDAGTDIKLFTNLSDDLNPQQFWLLPIH